MTQPVATSRPKLNGSTSEHDVKLAIEGMTCASCVLRVEKALKGTAGVTDARVNLALHRADVTMRGDVAIESLQKNVHDAGYEASLIVDSSKPPSDDAPLELQRRFVVAAVLAGIVLVIAMAGMIVPVTAVQQFFDRPGFGYLQFVLTAVIMVYSGRDFFVLAFRSARHLAADMNTLVAIGTGSAFVMSSVLVLLPHAFAHNGEHQLYFDSAAVIIALVLLGRWMEARAMSRTSSAIRQLMQLAPKGAHRVATVDSNNIEEILIDQVRIGDLLLVKPGESIPTDGVILNGTASIDESMMTGESMPVDKPIGATVFGGTLNVSGRAFVIRTQTSMHDTLLWRIIRAVEQAQSSKAPVQRLADKIASVFAPTVIVIAIITFIGWFAFSQVGLPASLLNAVAVLVIACPCAMGLAVPTAVITSTGTAAQNGILIKNVAALERTAAVDTIVFDKTGTLTIGRPEVVDVQTENGYAHDDVVQYAASVEAQSEHPLAQGIVRYAGAQNIDLLSVTDFIADIGTGVHGLVQNRRVGVVRMDTPSNVPAMLASTHVMVSVAGVAIGTISLSDTVKPEALDTIRKLRNHGMKIVMLTGDSQQVADTIARELNIDEVRAGVLPDSKLAEIESLKSAGHTVAMVGDGINDAPAMAAADVSVAMSTGTDIAMEAADATLLGGRLTSLPVLIALAKRTVSIIRQNLFWAFAYNIVGIPLAAFGMLNPMVAGAAMALSSVSVVSNSLRLRSARRTKDAVA